MGGMKTLIESSTLEDAQKHKMTLEDFKAKLFSATWYATASWRAENKKGGDNEWVLLQKSISKDDDFKCKIELMTQKEEGENDAIHVHENILPEFYNSHLNLVLGTNENKAVV